jgi:ribonucleoside-diphosphate reductase alpha chain
MAKEGSTISGFADAFAQAISYALQYGVPIQALVDKFSHVRFEPSGMTKNPEIRFAKSIVDYIFRWLASKFLSPEAQFHAGVNGREPDEAAGGLGSVGGSAGGSTAGSAAAVPTMTTTRVDDAIAPAPTASRG